MVQSGAAYREVEDPMTEQEYPEIPPEVLERMELRNDITERAFKLGTGEYGDSTGYVYVDIEENDRTDPEDSFHSRLHVYFSSERASMDSLPYVAEEVINLTRRLEPDWDDDGASWDNPVMTYEWANYLKDDAALYRKTAHVLWNMMVLQDLADIGVEEANESPPPLDYA